VLPSGARGSCLPLEVTPPGPVQQLQARLQADRDGWRLRVTDATGQAPPGPLWGELEAASPNAATVRPLQDSADGTWSAAWDEHIRQGDGQIIVRAWVAAPGYVTAAVTQTVPGEGDARLMFGAPEPPMHQTFTTLETAQAAVDFPVAHPGSLPTGAELTTVQVEEVQMQKEVIEAVPGPAELPQEVMSEQVKIVPPAGYESPVSPYQIGDEVELEGQVGTTVYVNGDERRVEAWFRVGLGPADYDLSYRLSGPPDLLEELAQYDRLHMRLRARVISDEDWYLGQGLEVIRFEKIWPEEKVQGFLGIIGVEALDGREVAIFTDRESGQRYVLFGSLSEHFNLEDYKRYTEEYKRYKQLFLTGVVRPDQTFAGLPVIEEAGIRTGSDVDAATSADQLPLEAPQVIDESRMMRLKGRAIIDRVELAYYAPPGALGKRPGTEMQPEFSLVQPVWVFHGHSEDGRATFRAYVQAVADDYPQ